MVGRHPEVEADRALDDRQALGLDAVERRGREALDRVGGATVAEEHRLIEKHVGAANNGVVEAAQHLIGRAGDEARFAVNLQQRLVEQQAFARLMAFVRMMTITRLGLPMF